MCTLLHSSKIKEREFLLCMLVSKIKKGNSYYGCQFPKSKKGNSYYVCQFKCLGKQKMPSILATFMYCKIHQKSNFSSFVMDVFRNYFESETAFSDWQPKPLMPPISSFSGVGLRWGGRQTKVGWGQPTLVWPEREGLCITFHSLAITLHPHL